MPAESMIACLVLALVVVSTYVRAATEGACCSTVGIMGICEETTEAICDMCLGDYVGDTTECAATNCLAQCSVPADCASAIPPIPGVCSEPDCVSGYCSRTPLHGVCSEAQGTVCSTTDDCPSTGGDCICDYAPVACCIACSGGGAICTGTVSEDCNIAFASTLCPGAEVAVDVIRSLDQSCSPGSCTAPLTTFVTSCGPNVPDTYGMCSTETLALKIASEFTISAPCEPEFKCCSGASPGTCSHSPWDSRCCPPEDTVVAGPLFETCQPAGDFACCFAGGVRIASPDQDCCPAVGGVLVGTAEPCPPVCAVAEDCSHLTPDNCTLWSCVNNACVEQGVSTGRCTEAQTVSCDTDIECSSEGMGSCACGSDTLTCCYECLDQFGNVFDTICAASTVVGCNTQSGLLACTLAADVNFAFSTTITPPGTCDPDVAGCFAIFNVSNKRGLCSSSECTDENPIDYPSAALLPTHCAQNTTCCTVNGECVSGPDAQDASCCAGFSLPYTVPCTSNRKCCFGSEASSFSASEECCLAAGGVPQSVSVACVAIPTVAEPVPLETLPEPLCRIVCGDYPESIDVCFSGNNHHCSEASEGMSMIMEIECSMDASVGVSCATDHPDSIDCGDKPCELAHSSNGGGTVAHTPVPDAALPLAHTVSLWMIPIAVYALPN